MNLKPLVCDCGSKKFRLYSERIINDASIVDGDVAGEHTIEKEKVLSLQCLKCGKMIVENYEKKPISREAWKNFWEDHIFDFIIAFDHHIANSEEEPEDKLDAYLQGIAKGMFALQELIESEMVAERKEIGMGRSRKNS
jgi:hypothetical protein